MLSNTETRRSSTSGETNNLKTIYHKFQNFIGRGSENSRTQVKDIISARSMASDESFTTPISSTGDLLNMSPKQAKDHAAGSNVTSDLLTGADSICDVTMHEVALYEDMFIDANSLDYLVKCAESNHHHTTIDRGNKSLFVKFDPLYASGGLNATESVLEQHDVGYETGSSASVSQDSQVVSPKQSVSAGCVQPNSKDKPMQLVSSVINLPQIPSTTALVRSVSAILTPAYDATESLISFSGHTPPTAAPRSPRYQNARHVYRLQSVRTILHKQDKEIIQLTHKNRKLKSSLQEYENRSQTVQDLEAKIERLSNEKDNLLERENKLIQQVNEKVMSNRQMSIVMEEYEKTISSLIGEQQQEKLQYKDMETQLISERDQALAHLASMESTFNYLLSKYEKCKAIVLETKEREKVYEQKLTEFENGVKKYEKLYNDLKSVTSQALNKADVTLESTKKNYKLMKLNASIKKHEITIASLQESLKQKIRDNEELSRICDQLINEDC